jgi:Zn-dependent protease with chaperone function
LSEVVFPLLGTAFVVLVVLPVSALLAKLGLWLLERDSAGGPLHGLTLRYLLLTGSSLLPLAWFVSAALHQAETGQSALACLFDHDAMALCFEPGMFALTVSLFVLARSRSALRAGARLRARDDVATRTRLERLLERPMLGALRGRVVVTDASEFAIGTQGWFRPRVFVNASFAARLTDEMLASALGHESAHVRLLDPLRYAVLQLGLALNPFGRFLLEPHAYRWYAAREAHCDRDAVIRGALPLPLADAIVRAARPGAPEAVALGARDTATLEFRIRMLLAFAERSPERCCRHGASAFPLGSALLLLALLLPHQTGTAALDALHTGAEHALTYFWR